MNNSFCMNNSEEWFCLFFNASFVSFQGSFCTVLQYIRTFKTYGVLLLLIAKVF